MAKKKEEPTPKMVEMYHITPIMYGRQYCGPDRPVMVSEAEAKELELTQGWSASPFNSTQEVK